MENTDVRLLDIITDIRYGMDQAQLMLKYDLSPTTVSDLFRRMIERGLL
jgi:DNA-binding IclR family transcriptional regulator